MNPTGSISAHRYPAAERPNRVVISRIRRAKSTLA
jgi:hypothetical protein